jgi:hypothetical protein
VWQSASLTARSSSDRGVTEWYTAVIGDPRLSLTGLTRPDVLAPYVCHADRSESRQSHSVDCRAFQLSNYPIQSHRRLVPHPPAPVGRAL